MKKKLLFLVSEEHYFVTHRLDLAKAFQAVGFEIALATRSGCERKLIETAGIKIFSLQCFGRGVQGIWHSLSALFEIGQIYRRYRPDVVFQVAVKPVIFGSFWAWILRVPNVLNNLGGLGYLFTNVDETGFKKKIYRRLFCFCLSFLMRLSRATLIVQNQDDQKELLDLAVVTESQIQVIPGCGVDLVKFNVKPVPLEPPVRIVCVARMLKDKGIGELAKAANRLKQAALPVEVFLYGSPDPENPASLTEAQLSAWQALGMIQWMGETDQVAEAYANAHIAVLPSYREGLPKSLLEAAACGRPIVTTNVPGCREVVEEGLNGFLVPAKDPMKLFEQLQKLVRDSKLRARMGQESRRLMERKFDPEKIYKAFLGLV